MEATGTPETGNLGRGTTLKVARQRISRPHAGPQGVGTNVTMQRLRLRIAQHDRLRTLEGRGSSLPEVNHLRRHLTLHGWPTDAERHLLDRWLHVLTLQRTKSWQHWVNQQLGRSGGKLYKWSQRAAAEDQLTTLTPAPPPGANTSPYLSLGRGHRCVDGPLAGRATLATYL